MKASILDIIEYNFKDDNLKLLTKRNYLTHNIHKYYAKLIPEIPHYFISKYTKKGDIVLDPFCGSGTVLLEAKILKRKAIGIDINPVAKLIADVKTTYYDIEELKSGVNVVLNKIKKGKNKSIVNFPNIYHWFSEEAINDLGLLKYCIEEIKDKLSKDVYKFLLLCFSSIIRRSSYADQNISKIYKSKRVLKKIRNDWRPDPIQYFKERIYKNLKKFEKISENLNLKTNNVKTFLGDARNISKNLNKDAITQVDFILTSPPYINAQDYVRSYKLELLWLDFIIFTELIELNKKIIGNESTAIFNLNIRPKSNIKDLNSILWKVWELNKKRAYIICNYFEQMEIVFTELYKILKLNGYFTIIIGNNTICGYRIPTHLILMKIAEKKGFKLVEIGKDKIKKRSLAPERNHNCGVIEEEWIIVFQK